MRQRMGPIERCASLPLDTQIPMFRPPSTPKFSTVLPQLLPQKCSARCCEKKAEITVPWGRMICASH